MSSESNSPATVTYYNNNTNGFIILGDPSCLARTVTHTNVAQVARALVVWGGCRSPGAALLLAGQRAWPQRGSRARPGGARRGAGGGPPGPAAEGGSHGVAALRAAIGLPGPIGCLASFGMLLPGDRQLRCFGTLLVSLLLHYTTLVNLC